MSRIEEAIRKAKELAGVQNPAPRRDEFVAPQRIDLSLPVDFISVVDEIVITSPRLVAVNDCNLPITEEYKKLKSTVVRTIKSENLSRRILVTSALSGEGKSVTALNLAIGLAQDFDSYVTLIDTDLRNPSICRYLGLERKAGLADCLADGIDPATVLLNTGLGSLTLLGAGRKIDNPVELLSSSRMEEILQRIEELIPDGYIVFDSAPILPFAEPRFLSTLVGSSIVVVKEGGTSLKSFHDAVELLTSTKILGVVYNKATFLGLASGYQYYYYDYARRAGKSEGGSLANYGFLARVIHWLRGKKDGV